MVDHTDTHYLDGTAAGFKGNSEVTRETGREAAESVSETLARRHKQMVDAWTPYGAFGAIPEQIADELGLPVHVVRPRAGELVKRGLFFRVGKRLGNFGCAVTVYSVVNPESVAVAA